MKALSPPHTLLVQALVAPLRVTLHAIADFDTAIAQCAHAHPDFPFFHALPGAGSVFAPRLLVAFGEQRERLHLRRGTPKIGGHRTGSRNQWQESVGTLAFAVSDVPSTNVRGKGRGIDPACLLGTSL